MEQCLIVCVQIITVVFAILMLFVLATYMFPNLFYKLKYHLSGILPSFSSGFPSLKLEGSFLKGEFLL